MLWQLTLKKCRLSLAISFIYVAMERESFAVFVNMRFYSSTKLILAGYILPKLCFFLTSDFIVCVNVCTVCIWSVYLCVIKSNCEHSSRKNKLNAMTIWSIFMCHCHWTKWNSLLFSLIPSESLNHSTDQYIPNGLHALLTLFMCRKYNWRSPNAIQCKTNDSFHQNCSFRLDQHSNFVEFFTQWKWFLKFCICAHNAMRLNVKWISLDWIDWLFPKWFLLRGIHSKNWFKPQWFGHMKMQLRMKIHWIFGNFTITG